MYEGLVRHQNNIQTYQKTTKFHFAILILFTSVVDLDIIEVEWLIPEFFREILRFEAKVFTIFSRKEFREPLVDRFLVDRRDHPFFTDDTIFNVAFDLPNYRVNSFGGERGSRL